MRLSCRLGWALACALIAGCGGTVQESGTVEGSGGTAGQGGAGQGGSAGTGGHSGKGGSAGGVAGAGGTITEGGTWCYSNQACGPNEWCDLEPAAPGMCASGGKAGTCKPRPAINDCPVFDQCPNACGCNGNWYCSACEAHVEGVSVTADNQWCMDGGTVISCGGWSEFPCPAGMFCDYPANDPCGGGDSMGVCVPSPTCPDPGGTPVCGCDGKYYVSECSAKAAGTDVSGNQWCMDGGTAKACGGKMGLTCAPDEWCDYAEGNCGAWDNLGTCQKKPNMCPDYCPGVCGCDSKFYCNDCEAHGQGIDDAPGNASCFDAGSEQYSAQAWSGGLDHLLIHKADFTRNVCLTIHLAMPHQPIAGFSTPDGWGLTSASISDNAADCSSGSPSGTVISTQTVTGSITFGMGDAGYMPCSVNVHATLSFIAGPAWVYPNELMNADGVVVNGGCW